MSTPSSAVPITFGLEAEFDGTRTLEEIFMAVKTALEIDGDLSTQLIAPDKYLTEFDSSKAELAGMYDVLVFEAHEQMSGHRPRAAEPKEPGFIDMVLDSSTKDKDGGAIYLPEWRTEPTDIADAEGLKRIDDFSKIIQHFTEYVRSSDTNEIIINDWIKKLTQYIKKNPSWLSRRYRFQDAGLEPEAPAKSAQMVLVVPDHGNFNPVIAIHVNVAVPLNLLYTTQMIAAFPAATSYPAKVSASPEWPSCGLPKEHLDWAKQLIMDTELCVDRYLSLFLPQTVDPEHKANIAGVFRTLVYCYVMEVYILSDLCKEHFPEDKYTHDSPKDFYLLGLPKFNLGTLVRKLSETEKNLIKKYLLRKMPERSEYKLPGSLAVQFDPEIMVQDSRTLTGLFSCVAPDLISRTVKGSFYNSTIAGNELLSTAAYINKTLVHPLYTTKITNVSLVIKILDPLVIEFRAARGHGCYAEELPAVLARHIEGVRSLSNDIRIRSSMFAPASMATEGKATVTKSGSDPFTAWANFTREHLVVKMSRGKAAGAKADAPARGASAAADGAAGGAGSPIVADAPPPALAAVGAAGKAGSPIVADAPVPALAAAGSKSASLPVPPLLALPQDCESRAVPRKYRMPSITLPIKAPAVSEPKRATRRTRDQMVAEDMDVAKASAACASSEVASKFRRLRY